jgi:6-phosphogluconolactonase
MNPAERERPPGVRERRFDTADALATALAADIEQLLAVALRDRGSASLVVSGGSTPVPLFRRLRGAPLDWSGVYVTLADERWVAADDAASNDALVRRELLQDAAAAAQFVALKNDAPSAQLGAADTWARLGAIPRPFDVVVLGMGEDGHTASLFPGSPGIAQALDAASPPGCVAMSAPVSPNSRLSLNASALSQTRRAILHIGGERKWEVYRAAARHAARKGGPQSGGPPIATMLRLVPGLQVYWSP